MDFAAQGRHLPGSRDACLTAQQLTHRPLVYLAGLRRRAQYAAEAAKQQKMPVYTITLGTDAGSFELDGIRQRVPPNRAEMRELSQTTGGQAYTAESAGELKDVYNDIGSSVGIETVDREVTARFAGIAMLLAVAAAAATAALGVRIP
ncbi:hypothetical protein GCM10009744_11170 [Kribbella alba]|uniref:Uncharacterized protein n=1 Tax=Kribbella alba TaxID=190197 RepID=A0ABN2F0V1_9ACTN